MGPPGYGKCRLLPRSLGQLDLPEGVLEVDGGNVVGFMEARENSIDVRHWVCIFGGDEIESPSIEAQSSLTIGFSDEANWRISRTLTGLDHPQFQHAV